MPDIRFATEDHVALQRLVARGLAVTALPAMALGLHSEPGVALPPAPGLGSRRVSALIPAGPRPPAVVALLDEPAALALPSALSPAPPTAAPTAAPGAVPARRRAAPVSRPADAGAEP